MLTCEDMVSRSALTTGKRNLEAIRMAMTANLYIYIKVGIYKKMSLFMDKTLFMDRTLFMRKNTLFTRA
jgi:hypothetical protein